LASKKNPDTAKDVFRLQNDSAVISADGSEAGGVGFPIGSDGNDDYTYIRQEGKTNALRRMVPGKARQVEENRIAGTASFYDRLVTIKVNDYQELKAQNKNLFSVSTWQLLDALVITYTQNPSVTERTGYVFLPIKDYMNMRGITNETKARKQINADIMALWKAEVSWGTDDGNYLDKRILQEKGTIKNSIITVMFSDFMQRTLRASNVMPYSRSLLSINSKRSPNAYAVGFKCLSHKNMNGGKKNENIISVQTLLNECHTLPKYEDVVASNDRHVDVRIIKPFEAALDANFNMFSWYYCSTNGAAVPEHELASMDWKTFSSLMVFLEWKNYPDQTERLKRRDEQKAAELMTASKKRKKKATTGADEPKRKRGRPRKNPSPADT
jgi:hypothetical protein